jgi:spore coat protein A, manganese oxidase
MPRVTCHGQAVPWYFDSRTALAFYQSIRLQKFIQPLRGVGPGGIAVAAPDAFSAPITHGMRNEI